MINSIQFNSIESKTCCDQKEIVAKITGVDEEEKGPIYEGGEGG